MDRFILRFKGDGTMPDADLSRIRSAPGVSILDSSSPRMLLVQASAETIGQLVQELPEWTCAGEQTMPLPNPRPRIRSS